MRGLIRGIGADAVLECVGACPVGFARYVALSHGIELECTRLFDSQVHLQP
jgi:hypothetical protein